MRRRRTPSLKRRANPIWNMALRPQRTFRRRQVESSDSDSDGAKEQSAEEPAELGRPSAGCRTEGAERPRGARSARGRGRVWASSRRSPGASSRGNAGAGDRGVGRALFIRFPEASMALCTHVAHCPCYWKPPVDLGGTSQFASSGDPHRLERSTAIDVHSEPRVWNIVLFKISHQQQQQKVD